jgi:putative FmdB family regulatory protein
MPTYEYQCAACGHQFELFQSMTDPVKRKCPKCGKPKLQRLIGTGAGIIFKGGGFYQTDYRSDSYKKAAESEKKAAEPAKETVAKSESKPESSPSSPDAAPKKGASKKKKSSAD